MIEHRRPNEGLTKYIDELWYVEEDGYERSDTIMPTGQVHLVFNLGDPYTLNYNNLVVSVPEYAIYGQFKDPIKVNYSGKIRQIGIALKPMAIAMYFNLARPLYLGGVLDCHELDNALMNKLIDLVEGLKLKAKQTGFREIESLFQGVTIDEALYESMNLFFDYIEGNSGEVDIRAMAKEFGYSVSTIERHFKKHLGLTPKAYCNIIRFRKSMLAKDAAAFFYDQSHFIKECRKYTLKSPKELEDVTDLTLKHMLNKLI